MGRSVFLGHSVHHMSDVNIVQKRAGIILSDGINIYLSSLLCGFYGLGLGTILPNCVHHNFPEDRMFYSFIWGNSLHKLLI
jgi:hypothetical protein